MFKFLLIFFIIVVFVPPVRRFVFWLLVGRQLANEQKKANEQFTRRREGETKVDYAPPTDNDSRLKGGEYVDYEEVK